MDGGRQGIGAIAFCVKLEALSGTAVRDSQPTSRKETAMAERVRTRRNTLERRCLGKTYKRLFVGSTKGVFKMLEKIKKA